MQQNKQLHHHILGASPLQTKQMMSKLASSGATPAAGQSSIGAQMKKTGTSSFKLDVDQMLAGSHQNNLILSRGRPAQVQAADMGPRIQHTSSNYSKTLTAQLQSQQNGTTNAPSKSKGLSKKQGMSASQLNQPGSVAVQKKSLHQRTGSANQGSTILAGSSVSQTPQRSVETLNSKIKKKKRTVGNMGSFQQTSNSNSRGNLLVSNNQFNYLKQSQQLQQARNDRDSLGMKKSLKASSNVAKKSITAANHNSSHHTQSHLHLHTGMKGVQMTGISDSSFNNMTIRSGDKYNSTIGPVKKSTNQKYRHLSNFEQQVLQNAHLTLKHPLTSKALKDGSSKGQGMFQGSSSSTTNINKATQNMVANNYHSQKVQGTNGATKHHYMNSGGGSMVDLTSGNAPTGKATTVRGTNLNQQSVFQRSHHQIYHSKNQSVGGVSYSSNNSRFTTTRPKNPTDGSLSSKGSIDSCSAHHFGVSTGARLKQKLSQQQFSGVPTNQGGGSSSQPPTSNTMLNTPQVQSVSLQIDPEYLTNKSVSPAKNPQILGSINQNSAGQSSSTAAQFAVMANASSSKFNLVNRAAIQQAGQFPAVTSNRQIISPKSSSQRVASQSLTAQTFLKASGSQNQQKGGELSAIQIQAHQKSAQRNRKLSMKLSQNTNQTSTSQVKSQPKKQISSPQRTPNMPQYLQQQQDNFQQQQIQQKSSIQNGGKKSKSPYKKSIEPQKGNFKSGKDQMGSPPSQESISGQVNGKSQIQESQTIIEEQIEESAQNTKRASVADPSTQQAKTGNVPNEGTQKQQESQVQKEKEDKKSAEHKQQLETLKAQLKSQITKQASLQKTNTKSASNLEVVKEQDTDSAAPQIQQEQREKVIQSFQGGSNPNQPSSAIGVGDPQFPMSPRQALHFYKDQGLTDYEKVEILNYPEIFFLGLSAPKIKAQSLLGHNNGYDDERGDYQVIMKDHLAYRFEVLDKLGSGSFGQALKCFDHKTQQMVAIKVIRNKKRFQHQAGVELKLLRFLKQKDRNDENNIVRILDYEIFRKHLLLSFELLSMNLYEFIKQNNFQGVSTGLIRRFAIQILQALKFQRDQDIIHCDLKPENILLKQPNKSGIKIIDYGSSCFQNMRIYTYIQSRFYRAPEIILGIPYTTAIDMWSFGCIMAELYTGYPLFPGENEAEQLAYVMEIKGVPAEYIIELSSRRNLFFEKDQFYPIIVTNSRGRRRLPNTKTLQNVLRKCQDTKFIDFIDQCLDWDPVNRMTPLEALQHEWILEGLPDKVLVHHQRMFGGKEDKMNLKEASLTMVQGFPEDANTKTIYDIVADLKQQDANAEKAKRQTASLAQANNQDNARNEAHQRNSQKASQSFKGSQKKTENRQIVKTQSMVHLVNSEPSQIEVKQNSRKSQPIQQQQQPPVASTKAAPPAATESPIKSKSFVSPILQKQDESPEIVFQTKKGTESVNTDMVAPSVDSPTKYRKIIRNFPNSQSTKVLPPNSITFEKSSAIMNQQSNNNSQNANQKSIVIKSSNLTADRSELDAQAPASEAKKNTLHTQMQKHILTASHATLGAQARLPNQTSESVSSANMSKQLKNARKVLNFDKDPSQMNEESLAVDDLHQTQTELADQTTHTTHDLPSAELARVKKNISKNQSAAPLLIANQILQEKSTSTSVGNKKEHNGTPLQRTSAKKGVEKSQKLKASMSKGALSQGTQPISFSMIQAHQTQHRSTAGNKAIQKHSASHHSGQINADEEDLEEMMMPIDDEGVASYSTTQKIPISLIKKQDKASKLFQPLSGKQANLIGSREDLHEESQSQYNPYGQQQVIHQQHAYISQVSGNMQMPPKKLNVVSGGGGGSQGSSKTGSNSIKKRSSEKISTGIHQIETITPKLAGINHSQTPSKEGRQGYKVVRASKTGTGSVNQVNSFKNPSSGYSKNSQNMTATRSEYASVQLISSHQVVSASNYASNRSNQEVVMVGNQDAQEYHSASTKRQSGLSSTKRSKQ